MNHSGLAVTCPHSGLVHWWQFFGKTEDPTETCIGSSYFVLLPCLDFLWFASPFKNSQQSITILWCIIVWRYVYYSEKNLKAQSASTLRNFPKICEYQSNFLWMCGVSGYIFKENKGVLPVSFWTPSPWVLLSHCIYITSHSHGKVFSKAAWFS